MDSHVKPVEYAGKRLDVEHIRSVVTFHQLHRLGCRPQSAPILLGMVNNDWIKNELRTGYYTAHATSATADAPSSNHMRSNHISHHHHSPDHWKHCFDYLRQALMCALDKTLETLQNGPDGAKIASVDGWGTQHQCRNFDHLATWTRLHRASADGGIL